VIENIKLASLSHGIHCGRVVRVFHSDERPKFGNGNTRPLSLKSTGIDSRIFKVFT
jgi:hypothetical protein